MKKLCYAVCIFFTIALAGCDSRDDLPESDAIQSENVGNIIAVPSEITNVVVPDTEKEASSTPEVMKVYPKEFEVIEDVLVSYTGTEEDVVIPEGIRYIGEGAFEDNRKIRSVVLPEGVIEIGKEAFSRCTGLESVYMTDSVISLGYGAFRCCNLQQIRLSKNISTLPEDCFFGSYNLDRLTVPEGCGIEYFALDFYGEILEEKEGMLECVKKHQRYFTFPTDAFKEDGMWDVYIYGEGCHVYTTEPVPDGEYMKWIEKSKLDMRLLELEATDLTLSVGEEYTLRFNSGADADWASSDSSVVAVEATERFSDQKLTALKPGTAVITATIYGKEYTCTVIVE